MDKLIIAGDNKPYIARKEMLKIAEVSSSLTKIENIIFQASTNIPIGEIDHKEFMKFLVGFFYILPKDLGLKEIPTTQDVTRIFEYLLKFYSDLSCSEIKTAFELVMVGELDEHLPKGRDGKADRNHYQQFSLEYMTKILNAYKRRKGETIYKAIKSVPDERPEPSDSEKMFYKNSLYTDIIKHFSDYKASGKFVENVDAWLYYDVLDNLGLAVGTHVSDDEKNAAVQSLLRKVSHGAINSFVGECIRNQKENHALVENEACVIARKRALKNTYDKMIFDEIDITEFLIIKT